MTVPFKRSRPFFYLCGANDTITFWRTATCQPFSFNLVYDFIQTHSEDACVKTSLRFINRRTTNCYFVPSVSNIPIALLKAMCACDCWSSSVKWEQLLTVLTDRVAPICDAMSFKNCLQVIRFRKLFVCAKSTRCRFNNRNQLVVGWDAQTKLPERKPVSIVISFTIFRYDFALDTMTPSFKTDCIAFQCRTQNYIRF